MSLTSSKKVRIFSAMSIACLSTTAYSQAIKQTVVQYPSGGVTPGFGWNLTYNAPSTASCIQFDTQTATGQVLTEHFSRIADSNSLYRSLSISATAKMESIGGGGSIEAKFAHSSQVDDSRLNISIDEEVRNGPTFVVPKGTKSDAAVSARMSFTPGAFSLYPWAAALSQSRRPKDRITFLQRCGHGYVQSISKGARLVGTFSLQTHSDAEDTQISTSMKGGGLGMSFSASLASVVTDKSTLSTLLIDIARAGGDGSPAPISESDLDQAIQGLPKLATDSPSPFELVVRSYDGVIGYSGQDQPGLNGVEALSNAYEDTFDYLTAVTTIINNYDDYTSAGAVSKQDLQNEADATRKISDLQYKAVNTCQADYNKCGALKYPVASIDELRSHLLIKINEDPVDKTLRALKASYDTDSKELAGIMAQCPSGPPNCPGIDFFKAVTYIARVKQLNQQISQETQQFALQAPALPASMASTRITYWVKKRRDVLCALYPDRPCLSYADMNSLQSLAQKKIPVPDIKSYN